MAVIEKTDDRVAEVRLAAKAVDLLQCFLSGLDDIVLKIAKDRAKARRQSQGNQSPLRIEVEDVEAASRQLFEKILSQEGLSTDLRTELEEMQKCLTQKCQAIR
jgi:hypothetical protein